MDSVKTVAQGALVSPAAERNAIAILAVLRAHLPARGHVLEVAAGSGQHAVAFASALPGLDWTPSDPSAEARASIAAYRGQASLPNLLEAVALDMLDEATWPVAPVQAIYCANMVHISPWAATEGLMRLAGRLLVPAGLLALYGPFREPETPLADSNAAFDDSLKARNPDWGLRDRDAVAAAAKAEGLGMTFRVTLPANNIMLLFRRG